MRARLRGLGPEIVQVIFGPWPIRPVLVAFICFVIFQYAAGVGAVAQDNIVSAGLSAIPVNALRALVIAAVLALLREVHHRYTHGKPLGRLGYVVIMVLTSISVGTTRFLFDREVAEVSPGLYVAFVLRAFIALTIVNSSLGVTDARLRSQMRQTDTALELVQSQRSAVLEAEERARQSVATLLHDRVQAGLVAAMLQLRQLTKSLDDEDSAKVQSVIADIEAIRTRDVRAASRQLSPDLRNLTLNQALKVLASTYAPAMKVSIEVNEIDLDSIDTATSDGQQRPLRLGLYRIVEQALLNAAAHGRASSVSVVGWRQGSEFVLTVTDDGVGLTNEPVIPGSGSVIIDAWTAALGGTWVLEAGQHGAVLTACFPESMV